jgi:hypothetical protein|tara:strand:+ start:1888 stop:2046 length:159 start_codon:yes stop_codon:yes gene_type:complete
MIIFRGMKKERFRLILWLGFLLILLAYFFKIKETINDVKIINQKNSVQNTID